MNHNRIITIIKYFNKQSQNMHLDLFVCYFEYKLLWQAEMNRDLNPLVETLSRKKSIKITSLD